MQNKPAIDPIVLGKMGSSYGIRGWLRVFSSTEDAESIFDYQPWFIQKAGQWQQVQLESWKHHNQDMIDLLLEEGAVELPEGEFNAAFNPEAVVKVTDVLLASHENTAQIIDARPAARFNAEVDEPRPGLRRGHIPGALNVPWTELVREGELKTTDELDAIFFGRGVSYDKPIIVSCGSGVTAAVVLLALATLDVPNVKLYDGAWSEWGARADLPVEPVK